MLGQMLPQVTVSMFGLTFVEGLMAFISPCLLPLLPIYIFYLCGNQTESRLKLILNSLGFISGFTVVFIALGATASGLGSVLSAHRLGLQRAAGVVMILFGLNYIELLPIRLLSRTSNWIKSSRPATLGTSLLFGAAFALSWTPCLTTFLGSALLLASQAVTLYQGMGLLLMFSLGLAIPFLLTALLWDKLQRTFAWIKANYRWIKLISGSLLIIAGLWLLLN